jgi:phosphatidylserine/phosphatidylglycerophosphate/cardiolipin synthase-like enzyme
MVADDDLYWLRPIHGANAESVGDNEDFERDNVDRLVAAGDETRFAIRYMETNHREHLLHHNKFILFHGMPNEPDAVLCGAANLTDTGFWTNFENIYWVRVPAVVTAFNQQFARFWDGERASPSEPEPPRATPPGKMPSRNILP